MQLELPTEGRYQTKQELAYATLRDAIMHCKLPPGQRLVIDNIAQQLHVSPIPVREALQALQSERLVENIPHVGAIVARITYDSLIEALTVLEGLEVVATRVAAERLTAEHEGKLASLLSEMEHALQKGEVESWAGLNTQFHRAIARITGMPMLQEMTARALDQWDRMRCYFNLVLYLRIDQAQQEHYAILQAMRDRDYARLEQLVRAHNQSALAAYREHVSQTHGHDTV